MVQIGYYPGQPIPRPLKGKPIPPHEYNFDAVNQWINQLQYDVSGLPQHVQDQILGDFKRQLTVSATPKKPSYDTQLALQHGDLDEAPGVQLSVSINPLDWADDPGKQFTRTLEGWKKSLTNQSDIQNWIERRYYWEPVLSGRDEFAPSEGEQSVPVLFKPLEMAARTTIENKIIQQDLHGKNPFHLTDIGVESSASWQNRVSSTQTFVDKEGAVKMATALKGSVDKYGDVAGKFLNFTENVEGASKRNSTYNALRFSSSDAVVTEFTNRFGLRMGPDVNIKDRSAVKTLNNDEGLLTENNLIKGLRIGTGAGELTQDQAFEFANMYVAHNVADSMRFFGSGPTGEGGISGLLTNLSAVALQGEKAFSPPSKAHISLMGSLTDAREKLVTKEKERLDNLEKWVNSLETNSANGLTSAQVTAIKKAFTEDSTLIKYRKQIDHMDTILGGAIEKAKGITDQGSSQAKALIRELSPQLKEARDQIAGAGFLRKGVYHEQLEKISDGLVKGKSVYAAGNVNNLIEAGVKFADETGQRTGLINVQNVLDVSGRNYDRNDVADVLRNVEGGRLWSAYVMPEIRKRVPYAEPMERFLKERHFFGLVYDKSQMEWNVLSKDDTLWELDTNGNYVPIKRNFVRFEDDQKRFLADRDTYARMMPKNRFTLQGLNGAKYTVVGGNHFEAAESFYKEFIRIGELKDPTELEKSFVKVALNKQGRFVGFVGANSAEKMENARNFLRVLNGERLDKFTLPGVLSTPDHVEQFYSQVAFFKEWLKKHQSKIGLTFTGDTLDINEQNVEALTNLFKQLGNRIRSNDYISITWDRAGILQHLSSYANQLQTKVLKVVAPFAAPFLQVKNAVVNTISLGLTKFARLFIGTGTGGLGLILGRFLEPVIRFVVNGVVTKAQELITAFIKGDISKFIKNMDKLITNSVKLALYVMSIPLIIFLFISFMFFGTTFTTISQVDWTRTQSSGTVLPPGVGNYVGCLNDIYNSPDYSASGNFSNSQLESCFIFEPSGGSNPGGYNMVNWPAADREMFMNALRIINASTGTYFDQLCANGQQVHLYRSSDQPGWCGHVFGSSIVFLSTCSYTGLEYVAYLLAHETGHVFNNYNGGILNEFAAETMAAEGTLPTYDLNCGSNNSSSEDFAETIGNLVHVNCGSCSGIAQTQGENYEAFWSKFPAHYDWIRNRFGL